MAHRAVIFAIAQLSCTRYKLWNMCIKMESVTSSRDGIIPGDYPRDRSIRYTDRIPINRSAGASLIDVGGDFVG